MKMPKKQRHELKRAQKKKKALKNRENLLFGKDLFGQGLKDRLKRKALMKRFQPKGSPISTAQNERFTTKAIRPQM